MRRPKTVSARALIVIFLFLLTQTLDVKPKGHYNPRIVVLLYVSVSVKIPVRRLTFFKIMSQPDL